MVQRIQPTVLQRVDRDFAAVNQVLEKYKLPNGDFMTYDKLSAADKKRLQADLAKLAENISKLRGVIGV
jgi:iron uptake system component EfeO